MSACPPAIKRETLMKVSVYIYASMLDMVRGVGLIRTYEFDYDNVAERKVFAAQSKEALAAGQVVITQKSGAM